MISNGCRDGNSDKTSQHLSFRGIFVLMSPLVFLLSRESCEIAGSWPKYSRVAAFISWVETERRNVRVMVRPIVGMTVSERSIERAEDPYCLRFFVRDQLEIGKESNWETKKRRKARCQTYHERWEFLEFANRKTHLVPSIWSMGPESLLIKMALVRDEAECLMAMDQQTHNKER